MLPNETHFGILCPHLAITLTFLPRSLCNKIARMAEGCLEGAVWLFERIPRGFVSRSLGIGLAVYEGALRPVTRSSPTLFRGLGFLSIAFAAVLFLLFLANLRSRLLFHGPNYSQLLWMSIYCGCIGIGMTYLKKWAVALFTVSLVAVGLFVTVRATIETPFPWTLVNLALGICFCLPAVAAIRCWSELK